MTNPKEDRLISAALQRGLLRAEDLGRLDECTATRELGSGAARWGIRIDSLVERGFLSEADVEALERETSADPDAGSTSTPSSEDGKDFDNPVEGWDRYQILALLGAGGMGKVYKAFDPRQALSHAIRSYETVLTLSPHDLISSLEACGAHTIRALFEMVGGRSPEKDLASARECARRALDTDPTISAVYQCAGEIDIVQARWHVLNGRRPDAAFERARLALMKGHQLNPMDSELCAVLAGLCRWRAHSRSVHRQDPSRDIRQGLDWIEKALQIDHTKAEARATCGALYLIQARAEPDPQEKEKSLQAAREALSQAISINANLTHWLTPQIEEAAAYTR